MFDNLSERLERSFKILKGEGKITEINVAENHQYHNAMALVSKDAAVLIEEKDLTGERLAQELDRLLSNPQRRRQLEANAKALAITDANERIYAVIAGLAQKDQHS